MGVGDQQMERVAPEVERGDPHGPTVHGARPERRTPGNRNGYRGLPSMACHGMQFRLAAKLGWDPVRMIKLLRKVAFWEATFFVVLCLAWVVTLTGYKLTGTWQWPW